MKETWNDDKISWSSINEVCQIDLKKKKKRSKKKKAKNFHPFLLFLLLPLLVNFGFKLTN